MRAHEHLLKPNNSDFGAVDEVCRLRIIVTFDPFGKNKIIIALKFLRLPSVAHIAKSTSELRAKFARAKNRFKRPKNLLLTGAFKFYGKHTYMHKKYKYIWIVKGLDVG